MPKLYSSLYLFYKEHQRTKTKTLVGIGRIDGVSLYPWLSYNSFGPPMPMPQCAMVSIPSNIVYQCFSGQHPTALKLQSWYNDDTRTHHLIAFPSRPSMVVWIHNDEVTIFSDTFTTVAFEQESVFLSQYRSILPLPHALTHTQEYGMYKTANIYYGYNCPRSNSMIAKYQKWFTNSVRRWFSSSHISSPSSESGGILNTPLSTESSNTPYVSFDDLKHNRSTSPHHLCAVPQVSCVLVQSAHNVNEYTYIGAYVQRVHFTDDVEHFLCSISNTRWEPFIVGKTDYVHLIHTNKMIPRSEIIPKLESSYRPTLTYMWNSDTWLRVRNLLQPMTHTHNTKNNAPKTKSNLKYTSDFWNDAPFIKK